MREESTAITSLHVIVTQATTHFRKTSNQGAKSHTYTHTHPAQYCYLEEIGRDDIDIDMDMGMMA